MTGFDLIPEVISVETEKLLIGMILECLVDVAKDRYGIGQRSRVKRYGYDYTERTRMLKPIPDWLILAAQPHRKVKANSITINEYLPGHGIALHVDSLKFGPVIEILTLGGSAVMLWRPTHTSIPSEQTIPPRSLMILSGEVRSKWEHGIKGESVTETRYSIVFRERLL